MPEHGGWDGGSGELIMRRFFYFLVQTFVRQEKNRRDILDYLRALLIITSFILLAGSILYYLTAGK